LAGDPETESSETREADAVSSRAVSSRADAIRTRLASVGLNRKLAGAALAPLIGAVATLILTIPTLAPGVLTEAGGDSAEFQTVAWVLGTAHPTGYPSYVILGFLFSHLVPFGEPAFRMNLLQAFLAAGAVAGTIAVVQGLTKMRWIALAAGLLLLTMPTFSSQAVSFPGSGGLHSTPVFWRLSTYADPHMFHLALVALIFVLLLGWERRRSGDDPETGRHADRWLVAAAGVYGVALANHSLTLMIAPGIGLFVLAVAPRIVLQWRLILVSAAVLIATAIALWLELPIRAAMHAPLVYAHPDTWDGFLYVITGQQFGGIPPGISTDIGLKFTAVMSLMSGWLGPLGIVAVVGLSTSLVRRPRYVLLSLLAAALTSGFAAAYVNSDLERYYLVPVFVAFTYVGLGLADAVSLFVWLADVVRVKFSDRPTEHENGPTYPGSSRWQAGVLAAVEVALAAVEVALAVALVGASVTVVPTRQQTPDAARSGGVSHADQTGRDTWMRAVLASPDQGGLPANAVIVSNWSDSTTLWYAQLVDGFRPDVYIVDDRTRLDANLGDVWDVIDRYLGQRPVFLLRFPWNCDGMDRLSHFYTMKDFGLPNGASIKEVTGKIGPVVCS
jgi:hypothetical protein